MLPDAVTSMVHVWVFGCTREVQLDTCRLVDKNFLMDVFVKIIMATGDAPAISTWAVTTSTAFSARSVLMVSLDPETLEGQAHLQLQHAGAFHDKRVQQPATHFVETTGQQNLQQRGRPSI